VSANERDTYRPNNTDTEDVTIIVTVNHPPVARNDAAATNEDSPVSVPAPGVLNNDSDPDAGDSLTVTAVHTSGTIGAITAWNAAGSFTYDPNGKFEYLKAGRSATDSFTYTVSDGHGGTDTATVTITINGADDAPTDISLDNSSVAENQPSGTLVGSFSTADADTGDTFTYSLVSGTGDNDNASFTIAGNRLRTAASFDYETRNSYSIRVRTTDSGALYYEEVFIITITNGNDLPVAVDDSDTTPADTPVTIDVLHNDSDPDGDALTVASVTQGADGSVTNNGDDVTYTPDPGFSGTDSFTYTVSDGRGGTDTATVTVNVTTTLARINVQIDTGPTASIYIWDDTTDSWAIDEDTQEPIDGTHHVTSDTITVAGGHYYYVWIEAAGVTFYPKNYPKDWTTASAPEGDSEAAYGYAAAGSLCPIHFTMK
jgi:VCBS repeat-containing protein